MPRADMTLLLGLSMPYPPKDEQHRVVDLLGRAEGIVRLRREAQRRAHELIPALFVDMFGDPAANPKSWPKQSLEKVCEVSYGIADKLDSSITAADGVRILTISNVLLDGTIDFSVERFCRPTREQTGKASVQTGDLLFNWRNGSEIHIGKTAIWESDAPVLHVSFLLRLRPIGAQVNSYFLWAMLNRLRATGFFVSVSRQQINRKFNASELSALEVPVPPKDCRDRFARVVEQIRAVQAQQDAGTAKAEAAFEALLGRVFSATHEDGAGQHRCT